MRVSERKRCGIAEDRDIDMEGRDVFLGVFVHGNVPVLTEKQRDIGAQLLNRDGGGRGIRWL